MALAELERWCSRKEKKSAEDHRREIIQTYMKQQHAAKFAPKKKRSTSAAQKSAIIPIKAVPKAPLKPIITEKELLEDKLLAKFKEASKKLKH